MNESVFISHPVLIVERILLKKLEETDLPFIDEISSYRPTKDQLSGIELLDKINKEYEAKSGINWGIYVEDELAGTIGFYRGFADDIGEIGYVTRKRFRKQGFTFTALNFLIDFGLSVMELKQIVAYTSEENIASKSLLEKTGFVRVESSKSELIQYEYKT